MPCIMNAANEVAVQEFLDGSIGFLDIADRVERAMQDAQFMASPTIDDLIATDKSIRQQ